MDMSIGDNEDRGFYTETFHSSAWIYQGDDVGSGAIPLSLNTRTRAVSSKPETVILQENHNSVYGHAKNPFSIEVLQ